MKIAYTMAPGRGDTDLLLLNVADQLATRGYQTCGTVQINTQCDSGSCDMDVKILPRGPQLQISQDLGKASKGCRLDANALETAVGLVSSQLEAGADVLIINKFGKQEADGRGFRMVIAEAISRDIPVLIGVNQLNLAAFQAFVGDEAVQVPPHTQDILAWIDDSVQTGSRVA